ncbi:hypothetical protein KC644_04160 [Candidatus Berkelbacteria bacterium]|nr:hypothetical protein [Candidatus Berkelbacteria bacterium]
MARRRRSHHQIKQEKQTVAPQKTDSSETSKKFLNSDLKKVAVMSTICLLLLAGTFWYAQTSSSLDNLAINLYDFLNL